MPTRAAHGRPILINMARINCRPVRVSRDVLATRGGAASVSLSKTIRN